MNWDNGLFSDFGYGLLKLSNNIYIHISMPVFKIVIINY